MNKDKQLELLYALLKQAQEKPDYISEEEIKLPTNVLNVLTGVILGLLATNYLSGNRGLDLQQAMLGGGLGGLLGLLGPEWYSERMKPTLKTLLFGPEEDKGSSKPLKPAQPRQLPPGTVVT